MNFGFGAMAAGAKPGATTFGALGEGGLAAMEAAKQNALARAQQQLYGQNTVSKQLENALALRGVNMQNTAYGMPAMNMPGVPNLMPQGMSQGTPQGAQPGVVPENDDTGSYAGMPTSPHAGIAFNPPQVRSEKSPLGDAGGNAQPTRAPKSNFSSYNLNAIANGPYSPSTPEEAYAASGLAVDAERKKQLMEYALGGKISGSKAEATYPYDVRKAAAGATRVSVGAQEREEDKKVGAAFGEDYVGILKAGREAPAKIAKYDRMNQLLEGVETGTFKGTTTQLKATAKSFGVDLEQYGIKDDVAPIQAAQALTNAMALELRNPSGGAGMPGALSDQDRTFLTSMVPGIEKTKEGRSLMTDTAKNLAKRDAEVAQLARNYRSKNGRLDEGFYDVLAQYSDANPLFKTPLGAGTPQIPGERPPLSTFMK